jgi:predicted flavoprotein YhiN
MNERVWSLLAKAHLDVMEDLGDIDSNQVAERFAELIVRECISTLDKDDGATHHSELLLEHFGVEE